MKSILFVFFISPIKMVKANHPAFIRARAPLNSSGRQPNDNEQTESIISDIRVDQILPTNETAENIPIISNKHIHQQSKTSKITKKTSRPVSERLALNDTWNNAEILQTIKARHSEKYQQEQQQ